MSIDRAAIIAAPVAVSLCLLAGLGSTQRPTGVAVAALVVGVVIAVVLAVRRSTGPVAVAGLAVIAGCAWLLSSGVAANLGWFTLCVVVAWSAFVTGLWPTVVLTALAAAGFAAEFVAEPGEPGWGPWTAGTVFSAAACLMARRQRELLAALQEAQAGLAVRAAAEERNRIAHELHDVIGHALTVSVLHVTSARLALDDDPAEAAASLAEAERLAQQSLAEVRAVVGLMKDAADAAHAPLPGAAQVPDLVASFERAGTAVDLAVTGDPTTLTAAEGLTVYRILQEALTNAAKHAPGSATSAALEVGPGRTVVRVDSTGAAAPGAREGSGVLGMRQRAEALGGTLAAGPREGGWRVEAVLPS
ncbi:histidine kinase [Nocardioides sp. C4-1]|uniref:sensor histidine kinase n=1 Tax=Nocardioides sp. C4-1 TaxID=3151851 RepID=UPI003265237D